MSTVLCSVASKALPPFPLHQLICPQSVSHFTFLTTGSDLVFAVVLRSVVRCFILRNFWWDDFTIIGAIVFTLAYLAEIIFLRSHGLGLVMSELTINDMIAFLKATLAVEVTYYMAVGLIKTSIVLLYLRFGMLRNCPCVFLSLTCPSGIRDASKTMPRHNHSERCLERSCYNRHACAMCPFVQSMGHHPHNTRVVYRHDGIFLQ